MKDYVIIFGAAVRPSGHPSPTLRHRIEGALAWAEAHPQALLMPTGGRTGGGPSEAEVVTQCLAEAGIDPARIVPEACARDTLESVRLCDDILRRRGDCGRVICCTSPYHQPRCLLLLRLLGYKVVLPPMPHSWRRLSALNYGRVILRELLATPYDALLMLASRRRRH
ncbi:MAG: hypothetical protein JWO81_1423 [Alphaproteobacteria bacterium]|nr:hypothetical protein [Alphaproteobacteria bacterium]